MFIPFQPHHSFTSMDNIFFHLFVFLVPLVLIFFLYKEKNSGPNKLPPGKTGWPIIGETWDFAMAMKRGTPEKFINERISEHSTEVFRTCLFRENMVVFCGASGNKFLFSNENKYVTSWWPSSVEKVLYPPEIQGMLEQGSKAMRSFLIEMFKPESLQHYTPIMDSSAKQHLETNWTPYQQVKVFPLAKKYTFSLAFTLFMNINKPDQVNMLLGPFTSIVTGLISLPIDFPGTKFRRAIQAGKIIRAELVRIIKQRKKELQENKGYAGTDVLTRMLLQIDETERGENSNTTSEMHISVNLLGLLIASYEAVSTAIAFAIYHLARYPCVYKRVMEEQMEVARSKRVGELLNWDDIQKMKYSWCVACETMRLFPPSAGTFREAITDFKYANFTIPKGWKAHWTTNSTHKNPKYFANPENFDPSRFEGSGPQPYTFVPFGGGPRMCVGKEYARMQILVFMHNVVTRFKFKELKVDEKIICNPNPIPSNGLQVQLETVDNI